MLRDFDPSLRRRTVLGALVGAILVPGGTVAGRQSKASGGGKPQFQGDAANTGYRPTECPPTNDLAKQWEVDFETIGVTLAAAGDAVYATADVTSAVYAIDAAAGTVRWEQRLSEQDAVSPTSPAVVGDTVLVGGETLGRDRDESLSGTVHALDAADGTTRWRTDLGDGPTYVTTAGDAAFVGARGATHALDVEDGTRRWQSTPSDSSANVAFPAVADGTVYYASDAGRVYAVDAADGDRRWAVDGVGGTAPSVADGRVYVGRGDGSRVSALDAADGSVAWRYDLPGDAEHAPTVADGHVFVLVVRETEDGYDDGVLTALDAATGDHLWTHETRGIYVGPLPPLVAGDRVLIVGNPYDEGYANALYVVDVETGRRVHEMRIRPDVGAPAPVVLDDTLLIGDCDGAYTYVSAYTGETDCGPVDGGGDGDSGDGDGGDSDGDDGGGDGDDGGDSDGQTHTVMVTADDLTAYTFAVDGSLEPDTAGGAFAAESADDVVRNDDGTVSVSDETGTADPDAPATTYYGDRFLFTGSVTELALAPDSPGTDVNVYLDEDSVSRATVLDVPDDGRTHTLMVTADGLTTYSFTVDGSLEPDTAGGAFAAESGDAVTERGDGTLAVSDETGTADPDAPSTTYYGDRFLFSGDVTELSLTPRSDGTDVNVYLDEELVTPSTVRGFDGE